MAERVPDGPERREPDAFFRPALPAADDAGALARTLLLLGRPPSWPD